MHEAIQSSAEAALLSGERVVMFELGGARYWVKRQQSRGLLLRLQKGSAKNLMQQEIAALKSFEAANILVPQIVFESKNYFVTKDCGESFETVVRSASEPANYYHKAANCIGNMHSAGLAHGGLHLRNMWAKGESVGFLDLEKASFADVNISAQAYDLVVFIWSSISINPDGIANLQKIRSIYMENGGSAWSEAILWCKNHNWMRQMSAPLRWHELRFKQTARYRRYHAVPLVLDYFQKS